MLFCISFRHPLALFYQKIGAKTEGYQGPEVPVPHQMTQFLCCFLIHFCQNRSRNMGHNGGNLPVLCKKITMCCRVLQCGTVCCNVLQCVVECCSVSQFVQKELLWSFFGRALAVCCSVLWCVAVCCSVLQRVAAFSSVTHVQEGPDFIGTYKIHTHKHKSQTHSLSFTLSPALSHTHTLSLSLSVSLSFFGLAQTLFLPVSLSFSLPLSFSGGFAQGSRGGVQAA